jgi:hypothetical protein
LENLAEEPKAYHPKINSDDKEQLGSGIVHGDEQSIPPPPRIL